MISEQSKERQTFQKALLALLMPTAALLMMWQVSRSGESNRVPDHVLYWSEVARRNQLKVGDVAPDFRLAELNGEKLLQLSSLRCGKPMVLVFGSYSCPYFRVHMQEMNSLYASYGHDATFVHVYIREAHPEDEGRLPENRDLPPIFAATDLEERKQAAATCAAALDISMRTVVDDLDNHVAEKYRAWPERAYVIDGAGKIAYASVSGIDCFALAAALETLLR